MTDWYVGQKVVCIGNEHDGFGISGRPIKYKFKRTLIIDKVYTINQIAKPRNENNDLILCFAELVHPFKKIAGFPASLFRPLLDKPTDISIFTEMLNTNNLELVK